MKQKVLSLGLAPEKNPAVYINDGKGRDTYISYNNGGNFSQEFRFLVLPQQSQTARLRYNQSVQSGGFTNRLFYHGDGSGRDTYVQNNVLDKFSSGQINYKTMLRSDNNFGSFIKMKYQLPPLAQEKIKQLHKIQLVQSSRLSMPKKFFSNDE